jgi:molybdate transport system substrate-binding protein
MRSSRAALVFAAALVLSLAACAPGNAGDRADEDTNTVPPAPAGLNGAITVFAAASLAAAFTELGSRFEQRNPGASVDFSFAGSSSLATQVIEGAPADVFASADTTTMHDVGDAHLLDGEPVTFATNTLAIAVPAGNPASVGSFADLARRGLRTVICAPQVPCGAATAEVQKLTGITVTPVSEELSVVDVLGKVSSGEADAGVVYVTDVKAAGSRVDSVPFPEASSVVNRYAIAQLAGSNQDAVGAAFIDFVTGPAGRAVLGAAGFGAP